ncbi:Crp/Fnr family transcriptional regulator [Thiohalobacter sp. COW1]|uniref:Transcriptional regulator n=1 Tax=Thiohalobacter thiocyanaticus TaxID=585455 RepID=A0A1Z4VN82_9GAMM|nr:MULTISPECIES: Crp/Fnr family transcriptional regulator [Thiohalobacter]BAZ92963.1 transcriptional regulator [Thiohalobacter thiocyanaticus]BCO32078.1 Crp/Fnr family transcriptional regulator [Thiohalobacter sp. COW1]
MTGQTKPASYCTDRKWKGRADCSHCGIRRLMLFSELPEVSFAHLLKPIDNFVLVPGGILYEEGKGGEVVYSIRRGLVKLMHSKPSGEQRIVRLLGQGAVVGLELLDAGVPYQHTAMAVQPVDVCAIPVSTLRDLEAHHPELCDRIRQQLQYHVDRADHWIKTLNTGVARDRIAQLLLLLTELAPDRNGDIQLLPRDDMAAVVGMTPETASRIIADFRRRGLLAKIAPGTYRIEKQRLQRLCEANAGTE